MLSWEQIIQDYIIKHSNRIREVTKPMRERFGVKYFTYHRIDLQGKYTVLVDRPDWAERYVSDKFYLNDPYLRHPDVYKTGFCFIDHHGSEEYKEMILRAGRDFDLEQNILFIEKSANYVEFFGFSGSRKLCSLDQVYLNYPWVLKSFANHFRKEMKSILCEMDGEAGSLIDLKGDDFLCKAPVYPSDFSLDSYLKEIGKGFELDMARSLSAREKQCVKLLADGKSAKETGDLLKLSPRTVEYYFENIKNKLSCSNKQEIFSLAKTFEELGLLP